MKETTKTELKSASRLIVKNLPKHYTEERFRTDFAKFGDVTDTKIMSRNGRSRLFGFIGFKTAEAAEKTKSYFDSTYIDTSKISVSAALPPAECPRAWSKYSKNTKYGLKTEKIIKKQIDRKNDAPLSFGQFLSVVKRAPTIYGAENRANRATDDDSDDYFDAQTFLSEKPNEPNDSSPAADGKNPADAAGDKKTSPEKIEKSEKNPAAALEPGESGDDRKKPEPGAEALSKTAVLVLNTPFSATADEVRSFFSAHGAVSAVDIPSDRLARPKGFCFVHFARGVDAERLLASGGNAIFQGRLLTLKPALESSVSRRTAEENVARVAGIRPRNFGREGDKAAAMAAAAKSGRKGFDWVKIFLRPDAVADAMAAGLHVGKSEVLDDNDAKRSMAVKLALGETRLIEETKKFLISRGVNSDLFENKASEKRHQTAIFAKNLPFSTTVTEIRSIFTKFGSVLDVLIPPSRSIALVNFASPLEATAAFNGAAFKKFKGVPLFLDWAPENVFGKAVETPPNETKLAEQFIPFNDSNTIYVKNLNFKTTEPALSKTFGAISTACRVRIATKPNPADASLPPLSQGYGFVTFDTAQKAAEAIKAFQSHSVDGHRLLLQFAKPSLTPATGGSGGPAASKNKIVVKNLPFEATAKEVRELFAEFGEIKACRVPTRMKGHRGFAFVEFFSEAEAEAAFRKLKDTHLYGRHLVLQWAESGPVEGKSDKLGL